MIEYMDVSKSYDVPVLTGVSLTVADGETVAIVGPSGTGKSVLLKTTNGLVVPDGGDVRLFGESVVGASRSELARMRRQIGYVFQYAALLDSIDVFENVALGIPEHEAKLMGPRDKLALVARSLEAVRLDPELVLPKKPSELSGGMRKRVGLARAIVRKPRILLYDEPVTGLDPVTSAAVSRLIGELANDLQATSVIVTHDVAGALELCDRIALLDRGVVRFAGTPSEFRGSRDPLVRAFVDPKLASSTVIEEAR